MSTVNQNFLRGQWKKVHINNLALIWSGHALLLEEGLDEPVHSTMLSEVVSPDPSLPLQLRDMFRLSRIVLKPPLFMITLLEVGSINC